MVLIKKKFFKVGKPRDSKKEHTEFPPQDGFDVILQIQEQGQAEPLLWGAGQNADGAKQMVENVFTLRDVFALLMELLDSRHPTSFLGLLHPITDQHDAILHKQ
ncbi:hypothetical protein [Sporosarcina limicola]|uniref:Uncharacterized protein n=1 Tax=Sporosarcina limicola TaxID=34101 RepID=A0A927RC47_9BACL|nr:hypothetical protein [Sporosarcina limicola]MBE1553995.1 hypothetical protein [Sporosarcina limicola]